MAGYIIQYNNKKYINFDGYKEISNKSTKEAIASLLTVEKPEVFLGSTFVPLPDNFENKYDFQEQNLDKALATFKRAEPTYTIKQKTEVGTLGSVSFMPLTGMRFNDKYNKVKFFPCLKIEGAIHVALNVKNNVENCIVFNLEY